MINLLTLACVVAIAWCAAVLAALFLSSGRRSRP